MEWKTSDLFCRDLPSSPRPQIGKILITGATGYIGGRLVNELQARGYRVRIMVRAPSPEYEERWPQAEIAVADALNFKDLKEALKGIHSVYYLIHSLLLGKRKFESAELRAAYNFRRAAEERKVKRIIYLGGLGDTHKSISPHLQSRMRVAEELRRCSIPVTILRAAIIIGSGSASYEIIKHLVRNTPIFFIPPWARTRCQPISIRDVIKYLVGVLEVEDTAGKSYDIGGKEILTYEMMLKTLAKLMGKRRLFFHIPFSLSRLYAYLTSLLTPVPAQITRCLMGGCQDEVVCQNDDIEEILPFPRLSYKEALLRAMTREEQDNIHTRWSDAYPPAHELAIKLKELRASTRFTTAYFLFSDKSPGDIFRNICKIGGKNGWFNSNFLWKMRGLIDRILMGVGTSRGRRSSTTLRINDVIDFWRVEDLKENEMLLLRAEMKLPGKAWLKFNIASVEDKRLLSVRAYYFTRTLLGKLYWYTFLPFHRFIFYDLIHQIERRS